MNSIHLARRIFSVIAAGAFGFFVLHAEGETENTSAAEPTSTIPWNPVWPKLRGFESYPQEIQSVVRMAFELHDLGLRYEFASADPSVGGMDCSGSVNYVLNKLGWKNVPRPSDGFYRWVWEAGTFSAVNGTTFESYEWQNLKPGDLLFWAGTYTVEAKRDPAISHVMIYLGEDAKSGERVIFGASEGRRYKGERRSGVGLFDFDLPPAPTDGQTGPQFIGYSPIPKSAAPR